MILKNNNKNSLISQKKFIENQKINKMFLCYLRLCFYDFKYILFLVTKIQFKIKDKKLIILSSSD